ncbi:MAG: MarR family transcriptional regulator [Cyclobacteriaceae bacterium]
MNDEKLEGILYYLIEKVNKVSRRYAQRIFDEQGWDITKDQWLVLKKIADNNRISQVELARTLFKDTAAINRIINLMVDKKLVKRESRPDDKRQVELLLTSKGQKMFEAMLPTVVEIRKKGVEGLSTKEAEQLKASLNKMIQNLE